MEDQYRRFKVITSESRIHDHIGSINGALNREVAFSIVLNKNQETSSIEFDALESEAQSLKDQLDGTLLIRNGTGWLPVL